MRSYTMRSLQALAAIMAATALSAHGQDGTGLRGTYFRGLELEAQAATRLDAAVDFDFLVTPFPAEVGQENVSVRWEGSVLPEFSETYTFYLTTDDGGRLFVDGVRLVEAWIPRAATTDTGTVALTAGKRVSLRVEYNQHTGPGSARLEWSSPSRARQTIPQARLFPPGGAGVARDLPKGAGLLGEYYNGLDFTARALVRVDRTLNAGWDNTSPGAGVNPVFAARWTGRLLPRCSEEYTFLATSDDGVRLRVGDRLLIESWVGRGPTTDKATMELEAGKFYDIVVEYFNSGGPGMIRLEWASASEPQQIIPSSATFPPGYFPGRVLTQDNPAVVRSTILCMEYAKDPAKLIGDNTAEAAWSPDGETIAYVNGRDAKWGDPWSIKDSDIWLMDADGGNPRSLLARKDTEDREPAWSRDGKTIAFASSQGDDFEICTVRTDGTEFRALTKNGFDDTWPVFARDGKRIIYQSKRRGAVNLFAVDVETGAETALTTEGGRMPALSPDGETIAFVSGRDGAFDVWLMDSAGGAARRLTTDGGDKVAPAFSPWGDQLVYVARAGQRADLWSVAIAGGALQQLTSTGRAWRASWSRPGLASFLGR